MSVAIAFPDDDDQIRELGDRIAALTPQQAADLFRYLEGIL